MSKQQAKPLVSFIVLNWNGLSDTKECLKSLNKLSYKNKEIIVVDNGSTDGSKEYFQTLKDIILVDLPKNMGFTGGHIAGREAAHGDYIAIINNDLVLDKNWVTACLKIFEHHADAAIVGGKAFKWDGQNPVHNTGNEYYSYQEVDPETGYTRTLLVGEEECVVDSISGAALLIRQACLKKVGYLDENFFAYYEETDLIARLMRVGYNAYYTPQAHAWHKIAASTESDPSFYLYMMHRNRYFFATKNFDEPYIIHFFKNYRREVLTAFWRWLRTRDLEALCRLKAYRWVRKHRKMIGTSRLEIEKLKGSYVDHLKTQPRDDVTIIIPCYNYGRYVAEAIESALRQTHAPKKVLVINDGSIDNSKEVIERYRHDPLVEIIHKPNSGVIDTKNLGIKMSKTYWTVFLDADDKLSKNFLQSTIKMAKKGQRDIIYTDMRLFGAVNDIFKARPYSIHTLLKTNYINNSTLIKTSLLKQLGGYKTEMKYGLEDWELYISLVELGAKPQYLPQPLVKYRQHKGALSRNAASLAKERELIRQIRVLHGDLYRRHNYLLTVLWHGFKLMVYTLRYPGLLVAIIKAVPSGAKLALSHIYGKGLAYLRLKLSLLD